MGYSAESRSSRHKPRRHYRRSKQHGKARASLQRSIFEHGPPGMPASDANLGAADEPLLRGVRSRRATPHARRATPRTIACRPEHWYLIRTQLRTTGDQRVDRAMFVDLEFLDQRGRSVGRKCVELAALGSADNAQELGG